MTTAERVLVVVVGSLAFGVLSSTLYHVTDGFQRVVVAGLMGAVFALTLAFVRRTNQNR